MNDLSDNELDDAITRHLTGCINPKLGQATRAFKKEIAATRRTRLWISMGGAMAAGVAIAWMLSTPRTAPQSPNPQIVKDIAKDITKPAKTFEAATPIMQNTIQSATWSRTLDDGMGYYNNQPVRKLRRNVIDEVEWYDAANKATVRTKIPREEIYLIGVKTD